MPYCKSYDWLQWSRWNEFESLHFTSKRKKSLLLFTLEGQGGVETNLNYSLLDCRSSLYLNVSSVIFMCWLWCGQPSCLSQLGRMHIEQRHWFQSHLFTLLFQVTWLEVHSFFLGSIRVQRQWGKDIWSGDLFFCFCWWKFKFQDASLRQYMCSTIAPQLGCIFLVILLAYCKSIENPITSNFLAVVFFFFIILTPVEKREKSDDCRWPLNIWYS